MKSTSMVIILIAIAYREACIIQQSCSLVSGIELRSWNKLLGFIWYCRLMQQLLKCFWFSFKCCSV